MRWHVSRLPGPLVDRLFNTKLPAILSQRRSTTVSLETYPLIPQVLRFHIFSKIHSWFSPTTVAIRLVGAQANIYKCACR